MLAFDEAAGSSDALGLAAAVLACTTETFVRRLFALLTHIVGAADVSSQICGDGHA